MNIGSLSKIASRISARAYLFASLAFTALTATTSANAGPLKFNFSGTITDDPFGLLTNDFSVIGSYTFDDSASDIVLDTGHQTGIYFSNGSEFGFAAIVGGTSYVVSGTTTVSIANDFAGPVDQYTSFASDGLLTLELFLQDDTATALKNDSLPLVPPALNLFDIVQFRLFGDGAEFLGTLDSLACANCGGGTTPPPTAVPSPPTWSLMAIGLFGFMSMFMSVRWRRRSFFI